MLFYGISLIMKEKSNASALPSAASSATAGRESCYRRPRIDDFLLLLSGKTFLSNNANTMTIAKEYSFTVYRKRICPPKSLV